MNGRWVAGHCTSMSATVLPSGSCSVALRPAVPTVFDTNGREPTRSQFGEGGVEVADRKSGGRQAGPCLVDDHVEPGGVGQPPHDFALVRHDVRRTAEQMFEVRLAGGERGDGHRGEGDFDIHGLRRYCRAIPAPGPAVPR